MLLAISIFAIIMIGVTTLFGTLWKMQGFTMKLGLSSQQASYAVTRMTDLIRDARQADNGAYAVVSATEDSFTVYTDVDSDNETEQVRFFRDGGFIRMGVINPSSTIPVMYNSALEVVETVAKDVVDNQNNIPLFSYYDNTNTALGITPAPEDVRMVRITVRVDTDPVSPPEGVVVSSFASLRNLREW